MSLIEEALRRVPDPSAAKSGTTAAPKPPQATAQEPAAHSWQTTAPSPLDAPRPLNVVAVAILGLTGALLVGGIVWFGKTRSGTPPASEAVSASSAATQGRSAAAKKSAWPGGSAADQELILSGIVVGIGEPYAVINGEIFAQGDRIGNATLLEIASDTVTVRLPNGKDTVLRIPR